MSLRVAINGCGRMGRLRAESAVAAGAEIAFICDSRQEVAASMATSFPSASILEDAQGLPFDSIEAIFVCTPPMARGNIELVAIEENTPFFVEKPLGLSCEQLTPLRRALQEDPVIHAVGYMNRYRRSVTQLRAEIAQRGFLGISANWVNAAYKVSWWARENMSGGSLNEQASHFVDLARYLGGDISNVHAFIQPHPTWPDLIGNASIQFQFEAGQLGNLFYSCMAREKQIAMRVFTTDGELWLDGWDLIRRKPDSSAPAAGDRYTVFFEETAAFLKAVRTGDPRGLVCRFEDAFATQQVLDAVRRSAASGQMEKVGGS